MKLLRCTVLAVSALACASSFAQMKPEDSIKYRKAGFALIGFNFGTLGAMAQDKMPYDKAVATKRAASLAALSAMPFEHFGAGTDKGDTKALPEVWSKGDKFKELAGNMQKEVEKLADVAKNGDLAALKGQFGNTAKTCKACHDDFRAK